MHITDATPQHHTFHTRHTSQLRIEIEPFISALLLDFVESGKWSANASIVEKAGLTYAVHLENRGTPEPGDTLGLICGTCWRRRSLHTLHVLHMLHTLRTLLTLHTLQAAPHRLICSTCWRR